MEPLSSEECHLIALRTLHLKEGEDSLVLLEQQLDEGSNDLMGYMGEYYKLRLQVEETKTKRKHNLQYFVKCLPYKNAPQRAECERRGVFWKETTVYRDMLPNIQKYVGRKIFPQCFYCRDDMMVMEDLSLDYRHLKPSESYTLDHYKLVLEHLADLHAASIAWEKADNLNIGERFEDVFNSMILNQQNEWFVTGLKGIVFLALRHPKYQTDSAQSFIKEKLYNLLSKTEHLLRPTKSIKNVLCHRDIWDRNIYYKFASQDASMPESCCFVDFQLAQYCTPTLDIIFLLYVLVNSSSKRREIYDECLKHYFKSLQAEFVRLGLPTTLISWTNFLEECQRTRLAGLTLRALTEPQTKMSPSVSNKLRSEEPEKFEYYLNCDRTEMYLRVMQLQPGYEEKIMEPIEEVVDYLMENESLYA